MTTYESLKNHLQNIFLVNVLMFLKNSGSAPDTTMDEWMKTISHMHDRGWLYYTKSEGQIVTVVGAYRIKEFNEDKIDIMPDKEEGNILFINFAASTSKHKVTLKKMLSKYLKENPDITEMYFYARNQDEKFTRIKIGDKDAKEKSKPIRRTGDSSGTERTAEHQRA